MSLLDNDADDLSLEALLARVLEGNAEDHHKALIGQVEAYTAGEEVADVRPLISRTVPTVDGGTTNELHPTIRAVPVAFPRAGQWFFRMPIAAGDSVLLICLDRDIARWRQTGDRSDPLDRRTHHLAHAIAIPGIYPRTNELGNTDTDGMVFGRDGGATIKITGGDVVLLGDGATKGVARLGDDVQATIPANTVIVSVSGGSGGPAVGVLNPSPIVLDGEVTSASDNVKAVD